MKSITHSRWVGLSESETLRAVEFASRVVLALLYTFICIGASVAFYRTHDFRFVFVFASELLVVLFVIIARFPKAINRSVPVAVLTVVASFYFNFINLSTNGAKLLPGIFIGPLQLSGILCQIGAKVSLGRSFGFRPANRGVVQKGPYRLVRHPMYLGYLLQNVGLLLSLWSIFNFAIFSLWFLIVVIRILEEEKVLRCDPDYEAYNQLTGYRLIPLVF